MQSKNYEGQQLSNQVYQQNINDVLIITAYLLAAIFIFYLKITLPIIFDNVFAKIIYFTSAMSSFGFSPKARNGSHAFGITLLLSFSIFLPKLQAPTLEYDKPLPISTPEVVVKNNSATPSYIPTSVPVEDTPTTEIHSPSPTSISPTGNKSPPIRIGYNETANDIIVDASTLADVLLLSDKQIYSKITNKTIERSEVFIIFEYHTESLRGTGSELSQTTREFEKLTSKAKKIIDEDVLYQAFKGLVNSLSSQPNSSSQILQEINQLNSDELLGLLNDSVEYLLDAMDISEQPSLIIITSNGLELRGDYKRIHKDMQGAAEDYKSAILLQFKRISYVENDESADTSTYNDALYKIGNLFFKLAQVFTNQQNIMIECFILSSIYYELSTEVFDGVQQKYLGLYYSGMANHMVAYLFGYNNDKARSYLKSAHALYTEAYNMPEDPSEELKKFIDDLDYYLP